MQTNQMNNYIPNPIDTSSEILPEELIELTETIARNVHEVWAAGRIADGWKWGEVRDDSRKLHPCLIPYEQLSDSEREYDRHTAIQTIKTIQKLGFIINKP